MLALLPSIITALVPLAPALIGLAKEKRKIKEFSGITEAGQLTLIQVLIMINSQLGGEYTLEALSLVQADTWGMLVTVCLGLIARAVAKGKASD